MVITNINHDTNTTPTERNNRVTDLIVLFCDLINENVYGNECKCNAGPAVLFRVVSVVTWEINRERFPTVVTHSSGSGRLSVGIFGRVATLPKPVGRDSYRAIDYRCCKAVCRLRSAELTNSTVLTLPG